MMASSGFGTFRVGLLCGTVFGAAGSLSRRLPDLLLGVGAAVIVFAIVHQGVGGLEIAVRRILDEATSHLHLVAGVIVGAVLAVTLLNRGACRHDGGDR